MSELFWNKIFGAVLGTALVLFTLSTFSDIFFNPASGGGHGGEHGEEHGETTVAAKGPFPGYPIELPEGGAASAAPVEEGPVDYGTLLRQASVSDGEAVFNANCATCHNVTPDGAQTQAPRLWDIVGRPPASVSDYANYSAALQDAGYDWTYEHLDGFIERPGRYVRGTNMAFLGLRQQGMRMDVIAYLRSLSDNPQPLPEPLPEEAEAPVEVDVDGADADGEATDGETTDEVAPEDDADEDATADETPEADDGSQ